MGLLLCAAREPDQSPGTNARDWYPEPDGAHRSQAPRRPAVPPPATRTPPIGPPPRSLRCHHHQDHRDGAPRPSREPARHEADNRRGSVTRVNATVVVSEHSAAPLRSPLVRRDELSSGGRLARFAPPTTCMPRSRPSIHARIAHSLGRSLRICRPAPMANPTPSAL